MNAEDGDLLILIIHLSSLITIIIHSPSSSLSQHTRNQSSEWCRLKVHRRYHKRFVVEHDTR